MASFIGMYPQDQMLLYKMCRGMFRLVRLQRIGFFFFSKHHELYIYLIIIFGVNILTEC